MKKNKHHCSSFKNLVFRLNCAYHNITSSAVLFLESISSSSNILVKNYNGRGFVFYLTSGSKVQLVVKDSCNMCNSVSQLAVGLLSVFLGKDNTSNSNPYSQMN